MPQDHVFHSVLVLIMRCNPPDLVNYLVPMDFTNKIQLENAYQIVLLIRFLHIFMQQIQQIHNVYKLVLDQQ